jgi:hypothetical protein
MSSVMREVARFYIQTRINALNSGAVGGALGTPAQCAGFLHIAHAAPPTTL